MQQLTIFRVFTTSFGQIVTLMLFFFLNTALSAQMITGVWKGRINRQKAELKIIQNKDSLTGTVYYYENTGKYRRYSIKGYFNPFTNEVIWWDDQFLDEKSEKINLPFSNPGNPMYSVADFNCPGGKKMFLTGKASPKKNGNAEGVISLEKTEDPVFTDEWDFIIDNYTSGANNPHLIDSIEHFYASQQPYQQPEAITKKTVPADKPAQKTIFDNTPPPAKKATTQKQKDAVPDTVNSTLAIQTKFLKREKIFIREIPVSGDSVELRFYDNAEIDGDSISLFLNDKLIIQHLRLLAQPHIIRLAVSALDDVSELVMVAENMGSIPPNTSYMVAIVDDKRYEAFLTSTEGSSAMIRLVKNKPVTGD